MCQRTCPTGVSDLEAGFEGLAAALYSYFTSASCFGMVKPEDSATEIAVTSPAANAPAPTYALHLYWQQQTCENLSSSFCTFHGG